MEVNPRPDPVLVVDDEEVVRETLQAILEAESYGVVTVDKAQAALDAVERERFLMVIADVMMPGMTGLDLLRRLRARHPDLPVLLMTGFPTVERAVEAIRAGAVNFITKPFDIADILEAVERAARANAEVRQNVATQAFMENSVSVRIPSTIEHVAGVVHFLFQRTLLSDLYPETVRFQIRLAIDEAMTNALKHGNRFDASKHITVKVTVDARRFDITIEDEGSGFDPSAIPSPVDQDVLERLKEGGRGLFLIRCYMDGVEHLPPGNAIHMWKLHPSDGPVDVSPSC